MKNIFIRRFAIVLILISLVLYGLILVIPFTSVSISRKAMVIPILIFFGEITWWIGIAIVGKEFIVKIKDFFCNKFCCRKELI
jgi:hypothetical protein